MSDQRSVANSHGRKARTGGVLMGLAAALVLAVGGLVWSTEAYSGHGGKDGKSGWSVERKIDRMLGEVGASDDQRSRVQAIVKKAVADLGKDGKVKQRMWQDFAGALGGDSIDRDALEALRRHKMETADRRSRRMLTAVVDAAEVLTPAQRAELLEKLGSDGWKGKSKGKWKNK